MEEWEKELRKEFKDIWVVSRSDQDRLVDSCIEAVKVMMEELNERHFSRTDN